MSQGQYLIQKKACLEKIYSTNNLNDLNNSEPQLQQIPLPEEIKSNIDHVMTVNTVPELNQPTQIIFGMEYLVSKLCMYHCNQ